MNTYFDISNLRDYSDNLDLIIKNINNLYKNRILLESYNYDECNNIIYDNIIKIIETEKIPKKSILYLDTESYVFQNKKWFDKYYNLPFIFMKNYIWDNSAEFKLYFRNFYISLIPTLNTIEIYISNNNIVVNNDIEHMFIILKSIINIHNDNINNINENIINNNNKIKISNIVFDIKNILLDDSILFRFIKIINNNYKYNYITILNSNIIKNKIKSIINNLKTYINYFYIKETNLLNDRTHMGYINYPFYTKTQVFHINIKRLVKIINKIEYCNFNLGYYYFVYYKMNKINKIYKKYIIDTIENEHKNIRKIIIDNFIRYEFIKCIIWNNTLYY